VQEKLHEIIHEQRQGTLPTGPQQTLKQFLEPWLEIHKNAVRLTTYVRYRSTIYKHLLPAFGHVQLQKLTPLKVQDFYAQKLREGLAPKTVILMQGVLHKALDDAVRWNLIARNVTDAVSLPRIMKSEIKPLTKEQAQKLLEAAQGHRLEALLTVALVTGMRRGELLALRWQDINFDDKSLQVHRTVSLVRGHGYVVTEPKTAKGKRKIALPQIAIEVLKVHRVHQLESRIKAGEKWCELDLVFCNIYGRFQHPDRMVERFQKLLEEVGLHHMRFHDLRHSAATILLTMGIHPKVVQELLGHSTISITMDIYSHVLPSMQREAMDKWNDVL